MIFLRNILREIISIRNKMAVCSLLKFELNDQPGHEMLWVQFPEFPAILRKFKDFTENDLATDAGRPTA